jgi:hypothetical protein
MKKFFVLLGLTVLFTTAKSSATVEPGYLWTSTTQNAYVNFYAPDPTEPSGCTMLQAQVIVGMNQVHMPGPPIAPSVSMSLIASQVDNCTGVLLKWLITDTTNVIEWKLAESGIATFESTRAALGLRFKFNPSIYPGSYLDPNT